MEIFHNQSVDRGMVFLEMGKTGKVRCRQLPSGTVRYFLDFRPAGRIWSLPSAAGEIPIDTKELASRVLESIRGRVASGIPLESALAAFQISSETHILHQVKGWLASRRAEARSGGISPRSLIEMEGHVEHHWPRWEGISVHEVNRAQLDSWAGELAAKGLSAATIRNVMAYFRSFLRWLEDRETLSRVPRFPTLSVRHRTPQILTVDERERVLAALPEARRGIFLAMADLALRPNEARALQAIDFDPSEGGWLEIRRGARFGGSGGPTHGTKTGRSRRLPCTGRLAAWISAHVERDGRLRQALLFPGRDGMLPTTTLVRWWKAASAAAGVRYVAPREATRHTTATQWRRDGVSLTDVQQLLGHTNSKTTQAYVHDQGAALVPLVRKP